MPVDFAAVVLGVCSWGATYLLHSSCLLAGVWVLLKIRPAAGHALREALWKVALVGGVATASLQMLLSPPGPFGEFTVAFHVFRPVVAASSTASIERPAIRSLEVDVQPNATGAHDVSGDLITADRNREFWTETTGLSDSSLGTGRSLEDAELSESDALVL